VDKDTGGVHKGGKRRWCSEPHLQSISNAVPACPITEMNWSMMPQGILANSCSAFWQRRALSFFLEQNEQKKKGSYPSF